MSITIMRRLIWQKYLDTLEEEEAAMITPYGMFPYDFNFWIGHTNFLLTEEEVLKVVDENGNPLDGIEGFAVVSPYRFKLCVGEAFDDTQVKQSVQKAFGAKRSKDPVDPTILAKVDELKASFSMPYWIVYVAPNGKMEHTEGNNPDDIYPTVDFFEKAKKLVGGHIIKSW